MVDIHSDANYLIESQLDDHLQRIGSLLNAEVLTYVGPILFGSEIDIRNAIEDLRRGRKTKGKKLVFLLETNGGYITVAERIANTLRKNYQRIEYIITDSAMSAGTVLALSGDAIQMDYFSVLGPIDPQIEIEGRLVSALGYLEKYNEFIKKDLNGGLSAVEMAYFVKRFDPATLSSFEHQKELSISLLREWLVKYKFRDWKKTETKKRPVTHAMKIERAKDIAEKLNDTSIWHSHGRGIPMDVLKRKLNLRIEDFGRNDTLNRLLREYTNLFYDFAAKLGSRAVLHTHGKYKPLLF